MLFLKKIFARVSFKDNRTTYPETFDQELDYQCGRMLTFASLITLSWLTYIPIDLKLHPDEPLILVIRVGFPIFGLILYLSRFKSSFKNQNLVFLTIYGAYMAISNAVLTGLTEADPAYIGGFLFILTLLAVGPLQKKWAYIILATSLSTFFTTSYLNGTGDIKPQNLYSLNDLFCVSFIVSCFIYILNNTRYNSWAKSRQAEIGEEIIKIQKIYSESLERTVKERTHELEIERNNLEERNRIMENDIKMAKHIHEQLMPVGTPADFIHSIYKPMDTVGGDFYDFIKFRDPEKLGIFISDVSGHGLAAAFITSMIKTIILQSGEKKLDPADLLKFINEILYDQIGGNFVTAFYGIYNIKTRHLVFSNAGHHPPYIISDGLIKQLEGHKTIPLAIMNNSFLESKDKLFKNSEVTLPTSSKMLLYTDGFVECQPLNNAGPSFEESNMHDLLMYNKNHTSNRFIANLYNDLISHRGSDSFEDDVCLICVDVA
ncbi:MAG TPA: PP2C family protein-serine/threonine phosphatase [Spirochaetota bacterium]|nr:PP2C family protein-serine/threonine phosphatase [Spirochaetota bacterium]HPJ33537.1 PP2C family protein-serine/threonine phosphatase [Spirochaetota bacterium]